MKDKIIGYQDYEVIKKYEKLEDKIIVIYLDETTNEINIDKEDEIIKLMENQGKVYAQSYLDNKNYLIKIVLTSSSLLALMFGTFQAMDYLVTNKVLEDLGLIIGTIAGSTVLAGDIVLWKKLFLNIASKTKNINNQEKYYYYFKNIDILKENININELDNYNLPDLKLVVYNKEKPKTLKRKR